MKISFIYFNAKILQQLKVYQNVKAYIIFRDYKTTRQILNPKSRKMTWCPLFVYMHLFCKIKKRPDCHIDNFLSINYIFVVNSKPGPKLALEVSPYFLPKCAGQPVHSHRNFFPKNHCYRPNDSSVQFKT